MYHKTCNLRTHDAGNRRDQAIAKYRASPVRTDDALPADTPPSEPVLIARPSGAGFSKAQANAGGILERAEGGDRQALENSFDGLPDDVQIALIQALATESSGKARPADDAAVQAFTEMPGGALAAQVWKDRTAQKIGVCQMRYNVIRSQLTKDGKRALDTFIDNMPERAFAAALIHFGGR